MGVPLTDLNPLLIVAPITAACALQGTLTARTPGLLNAVGCAVSVVVAGSLPGVFGLVGVLVMVAGSAVLTVTGAAEHTRKWPGEANVGLGICTLGLGLSLVVSGQLGLNTHSALLGLACGLLGTGVGTQLRTRAGLQRGAALVVLCAMLFAFGMIYSLAGALLGTALCAALFLLTLRSPGSPDTGHSAQRTL
ncbi:hypothetical protein DESA109040_19140 [Deinococcus saxicola]